MTRFVKVTTDRAVAHVTLDRPERRNAFNAEMIAEVSDVFSGLALRDDIRVIVLGGNGPAFSAGADVSWMQSSLDATFEENLADARRMSAMFAAVDEVPQPVIARVHGACLGGGMGLVAVCDCVIATDDAVFGFTETKLGIIPAVISTFVLPKIGESWTRALYSTGERFGADLARTIGLVHWLSPPDELDIWIERKVQLVNGSGPTAVREAKRLVADLRGLSTDERREVTARRIAAVRTSAEGQEGLSAFLQNRPPSWQ